MSFLNLTDTEPMTMGGEIEFNYTEGDDLPEITAVLDETDLTGYTVTLHLRKPDDTVATITATDIDFANGCFKFVFTPSDLVEGCGQTAEIQFVTPGGRIQTSPKFVINVAEQLA